MQAVRGLAFGVWRSAFGVSPLAFHLSHYSFSPLDLGTKGVQRS